RSEVTVLRTGAPRTSTAAEKEEWVVVHGQRNAWLFRRAWQPAETCGVRRAGIRSPSGRAAQHLQGFRQQPGAGRRGPPYRSGRGGRARRAERFGQVDAGEDTVRSSRAGTRRPPVRERRGGSAAAGSRPGERDRAQLRLPEPGAGGGTDRP